MVWIAFLVATTWYPVDYIKCYNSVVLNTDGKYGLLDSGSSGKRPRTIKVLGQLFKFCNVLSFYTFKTVLCMFDAWVSTRCHRRRKIRKSADFHRMTKHRKHRSNFNGRLRIITLLCTYIGQKSFIYNLFHINHYFYTTFSIQIMCPKFTM